MSTFLELERGWFIAPITEKALAFAQDEPLRLAEAAFARFLSERGIDFHWRQDGETPRFTVGDWNVTVVALTEGVEEVEAVEEWTIYVRIMPAPTSLVTILGGSSARREPLDAGRILPAASWLLAFPNQWRPQEAA